nr:hypothetical protein [Tanacetum cinerariifolium]
MPRAGPVWMRSLIYPNQSSTKSCPALMSQKSQGFRPCPKDSSRYGARILSSFSMKQHLLERFKVLSEFRVKADLSRIDTYDRFDSVIGIVLVNGVRCMDLDLGQSARYNFQIAFASKLINVLRFTGFILELSNIIQGCPSLGVVSIKSCVILQDIDFSSQTLTEIEFDNCDVSSIKINAPNLHSFSYGGIYTALNPKPCLIDVSQCKNIAYMKLTNVVDGHWIKNLVNGLSNLKTLILVRCQNIKRIKVWNEKLERFEVVDCPVLASIELSAKSLKSFRYTGVNYVCDISFIASKLIKDLSIEGLGISDQWLESQIAKLHCLETLRLKGCNFLTNIKVLHDTLQILELHRCLNLVEADIDTPQLITFEYHGKLIKFWKMVSGGDCAATLDMESWGRYNDDQFYRWRDLLSYFGYFKPLKICTFQKQVMMIPERLRDNLVQPLYDLQHLDIQIGTLNEIDTDLVDSLLWLSPLPSTIHISSGSHFQMIIEFAYCDMIEREEDKNLICCIDKLIKCWRHSLKTVKIRSNDVFSESDLMKLKKYFTTSAKLEDSCCFSTGLDRG